MNTKKLTLSIVFAALAIALNPDFTHLAVAAPFAQGLIYQIWEIPIVVALLVVGFAASALISILNTAVLFAVFQGILPTGPAYNLAASLSMQLGIFIAYLLAKRFIKLSNIECGKEYSPRWIAVSTAFGITFRVVFMSILLYFALPQPYPIGFQSFGFDRALTNAYLPFAAFFNATLALYTIPIAYIIARTIKKSLRIDV